MKNKWILGVLLLAALLAFWLFARSGSGKIKGLGAESLALTHEILAYGPRPPESEALAKVKAHLAKELETHGWVTRLEEFQRDTPIGKVTFSNLRARLPIESTDTWDRKVKGLLGAHIDSKILKGREFLGADDSASACAAMVEIAKHLVKTDRAQAGQLELVFFDGEESFAMDMTILDGLYGSRQYANQWRGSDKKPEFGIVLDMIGHENLSIRIPSDSPADLAELMFSVAKDRGVSSHFGTAPGPIMDDHLPLNLVGIPTLDIIGDFSRNKWWHTTGDNASILSAESLDISTAVVLAMLQQLLSS